MKSSKSGLTFVHCNQAVQQRTQMELTLQRVTKIEFQKITDHKTFSTRTITITMVDGKQATVVCFAPNNEDEEPTDALKVIV
jgi:hypothetical protein